jgi:hypothetical protein
LSIAYNLIEHAFTFKFQKQSINREDEGGGKPWCTVLAGRMVLEDATDPVYGGGSDLTDRRSQR